MAAVVAAKEDVLLEEAAAVDAATAADVSDVISPVAPPGLDVACFVKIFLGVEQRINMSE